MTALFIETDQTKKFRLRPASWEASRLSCSQLYTACDLPLPATSAELQDIGEPPGQERAIDALRFAMTMPHAGYNVYVIAPHGGERTAVVVSLLQKHATAQPAPSDCCYVQNFSDSSRPSLLMVPAGRGPVLRDDIEHLTEELKAAVPAVLESDAYRKQRQVIEDEVKTRRDALFKEFRSRSENAGIELVETPAGFVFVPKRDDHLLEHEEFHKLPAEERERIQAGIESIGEEFVRRVGEIPKWEAAARQRIRELDRQMTADAIAHLIEPLRERYKDLPDVVAYIEALQTDVTEHANDFVRREDVAGVIAAIGGEGLRPGVALRYRVNVLVAHDPAKGAPIVVAENPTHTNLVGYVDYIAHLGAMVTDFNLIKPGDLHRANGGCLVVDARKLLLQPWSWETLKRALRTSRLEIESPAALLGLSAPATLHPEPAPLKMKAVIVGDRTIHYLLSMLDPDFSELFKVTAEFEDRFDRDEKRQAMMARLAATIARRDALLPFDGGALASVIEQCARSAGHAHKLSTEPESVADLMREADHWAREEKREMVSAADVERAVAERIHRLGLLSERLGEEIGLGTILIDTDGEKVGVVNGLSVFQAGNVLFGRPSRITASVGPGGGEVIDIEREVKLGGPIHSKGVLILSGLLAGRYASECPLSLSARLVFEQSYGGIEGDSASAAELFALLSAISGIPLRQSLAVTGSVNQIGQMQAIGAVNEKIEGFFDACKLHGLTGRQGVIIPSANVQHLMLRKDVIEAVRMGRFHVHAVSTIDEGIEVLTGFEAGVRDGAGEYPVTTVNGLIQKRLAALAQVRRAYQPAAAANRDER